MKIKEVYLEAVGVSLPQFPTKGLPEFAFVGRSNAGKSSLINTMTNRNSIARTSRKPGKTRTINFYNVNEELYFVDLPGYGYAEASKSETQRWGRMIETYLKKRETLKAVILLLDIRHKPSALDSQMYEWLLYYKTDIIAVATKSDKINRSAINKNLKAIKETLPAIKEVIPFSSLSKNGRDELWEKITSLLQ